MWVTFAGTTVVARVSLALKPLATFDNESGP